MKGLGSRQGQELSGDLGRGISRRASEVRERRTAAAPDLHKHGFIVTALGIWHRSRRRMGGRRLGAHPLEKSCRKAESAALEADYEFARQSLAAAVAA